MLTDAERKHDDDLFERYSRIKGVGILVFESKYIVQTNAFKKICEKLDANREIIFERDPAS